MAAPVARPASWLISAPADLALYSGIAFLSAPLVLWLGHLVEPARLFVFLNLTFTLGHYAPTWVRALGDRAQFRANRLQIILFPVLFFTFAWVTRNQPMVVAFVMYFWDRAHALLQNYGFLRLYEARSGPPGSGRTDFALLVSSALMLMTFNMGLLTPLLVQLHVLGLPHLAAPMTIFVVRGVAVLATLVCAGFYVRALVKRRAAGLPVSLGKQLFLVSVTAGHALMNLTTNIFLLSAHEKIYHSVQYAVLVWHYDKKRARAGVKETSRFFMALAGKRGLLLYLGVIATWTATVVVVKSFVEAEPHQYDPTAFQSLLGGIALTHYYFDSFLWRVRKPQVRENL
ncbi:MAG: hypothetical protein Q8L48_21975 [Archangium sp.]|nr:hypothetical protein [Archangium sp.]